MTDETTAPAAEEKAAKKAKKHKKTAEEPTATQPR